MSDPTKIRKINTTSIVARNTVMLYFRMLFSMIVTLYTSRVVLSTLGVEDFGIYNIVGGIVIMLGFLNNAMTASTQRFLTFEIGKNDLAQLKKVFSMSLIIHAIIAIVVLILAETVGLWIINNILNIPEERLTAANWVYQFSTFSFVVTVLSVPFSAAIIANEKMKVFAFVGVLEVILKLIIVYILVLFAYDKLILYSSLIFGVTIIVSLIYWVFCIKHFEESKTFKFVWDSTLFKKLGNFATWNLLGVSAGIGYNQGVNILLNVFFGPTVNAARAIAFQVQSAINSFVSNFQIAVNPSITKLYAREEFDSSFNLVFSASKFAFFLLLLLSMPLLIETGKVLSWWLEIVPEHAVIFTRLILIDILIGSISGSLQNLVQATGNIKKYQIVISGILLMNLPFSYLLLKFGYGPEVTIVISIFFTGIALIMRLFLLKKLINFPIKNFLEQVLYRILPVAILAFIPPYLVYLSLDESLIKFLSILIISSLSILSLILLLGLSVRERKTINKIYWNTVNKIRTQAR